MSFSRGQNATTVSRESPDDKMDAGRRGDDATDLEKRIERYMEQDTSMMNVWIAAVDCFTSYSGNLAEEAAIPNTQSNAQKFFWKAKNAIDLSLQKQTNKDPGSTPHQIEMLKYYGKRARRGGGAFLAAGLRQESFERAERWASAWPEQVAKMKMLRDETIERARRAHARAVRNIGMKALRSSRSRTAAQRMNLADSLR